MSGTNYLLKGKAVNVRMRKYENVKMRKFENAKMRDE